MAGAGGVQRWSQTRRVLGERWRQVAVAAAPVLLLVFLVLVVGAITPSFLTYDSLTTLLADAAVILLLAAGETFPILTGRIDLSLAAMASLTTVIMAVLLNSIGWPAVPIVILIMTLAGVLQGAIHIRVQLPSFIVTMAGMIIATGLALVFSNAREVDLAANANPLTWLRSDSSILGVPGSACFSVVVVIIAAACLRMLVVGRWIYAVGIAERAAALAGVPTSRVILTVFGLSALFAALAGTISVADFNGGRPALLDVLLLPAIAAVVVGGTPLSGGAGGLWRTIVGTLTIAVVRVFVPVVGAPPQFSDIIYGVIVIAGVALTIDRSKLAVVK